MKYFITIVILFLSCTGYAVEIKPIPVGPFPVATTNMEIDEKYQALSDEDMHTYLLGDNPLIGSKQYVTKLLKHPESVWITMVDVPDLDIYGHMSGEMFDVVTYVTFPTGTISKPNPYDFPYHNSNYGSFEHMLRPGEKPLIAKAQDKYPLVILSHGSSAHGIFDIAHANNIARHGYIVAAITYGENRHQRMFGNNLPIQFLRPLVTKFVIDSLLTSEEFGPFIDRENIGISGFSFGGFTALATAGGKINGEAQTAHHPLISAAVITAPWTGGVYGGETYYPFSEGHTGLKGIDIPIITLYGSKDENTRSDFILPAVKKLNGDTYVVELIDQTHALEEGSWTDRNNWELLFFNAYLKQDQEALLTLRRGSSMQDGNKDRQLFEFQKTSD